MLFGPEGKLEIQALFCRAFYCLMHKNNILDEIGAIQIRPS